MGDDEPPEPEPEAKPPGKPPKTLNELAESSGLEIEKLYAMEVATGDGETVTIGKLKDAYRDQEATAQETATKAAELNEREGAMIQEQMIWGQIGDQFNAVTTPEQRTALREQIANHAVGQRAELMRAAPELNSTQAMQSFTDDVVKLGQAYGIPPHKMVVTEASHMLLLRGHLKALKVISDLKKFKPKPKAPGSTNSKGRSSDTGPSKQQRLNAAAKTGGKAAKVNAVAQLLGGQNG